MELFAKYGFFDISPFIDQSLGLPHISDPEWSALVRLFQREWFERIWVVQEATVGILPIVSLYPSSKPTQRMLTMRNQDGKESIVVCGSYPVSWDDISNIAQCLRHHGHIGPYPVDFHAPKVPGISCIIVIHEEPQ
jgi:hypothetical protein